MAVKTKPEVESAAAFLERIVPDERRADARHLDAIFREVTGFAPVVWGASMLGYGRYSYAYDSGHAGTYFATGFAPRKAELVLYLLQGFAGSQDILSGLGRFKSGKSCLYVRRLADLDEAVLRRVIRAGLEDLARRWPVTPD